MKVVRNYFLILGNPILRGQHHFWNIKGLQKNFSHGSFNKSSSRGGLMPFVDPQKRRLYHRAYQRRRRAQQGLTLTPDQTPQVRAYLCWRNPTFRLPGAVFKNGIFITTCPQTMAMIEHDEAFGVDIFRLLISS